MRSYIFFKDLYMPKALTITQNVYQTVTDLLLVVILQGVDIFLAKSCKIQKNTWIQCTLSFILLCTVCSGYNLVIPLTTFCPIFSDETPFQASVISSPHVIICWHLFGIFILSNILYYVVFICQNNRSLVSRLFSLHDPRAPLCSQSLTYALGYIVQSLTCKLLAYFGLFWPFYPPPGPINLVL